MELDISELAERMLGENPARRIQELVEREALRLWHIERSKPKAKKPPGRPRLSDQEKAARQYATNLRAVYLRLKELYGESYQTAFGAQEAELEEAIEAGDVAKLVWFHNTQPWVKRGGQGHE